MEGRSDIRDRDQHKQIIDTGDQMINTYTHNIQSSRSTLPSVALPDVPVQGRSAAQEFQPQQSIEPVAGSIGREVVVIVYIFLEVS